MGVDVGNAWGKHHRAAGDPIVWVLHLGCAWLVVDLGLKALWVGFGIPAAMHWMHALMAGAFGTKILGVATRVALGDTGRALVVSPPIVVAYVSVTGTVLRVFVPAVLPAHYLVCVAAEGALWAAAFVVFGVVYVPILRAARRWAGRMTGTKRDESAVATQIAHAYISIAI